MRCDFFSAISSASTPAPVETEKMRHGVEITPRYKPKFYSYRDGNSFLIGVGRIGITKNLNA
jgi:hypothetical protein